MLDVEIFDDWLRKAKPGQWLTYHIGQHLYGLNGQKKETAVRAFRAAVAGDVFICQQRVEGGEFAYKVLRLDATLSKRMRSWTLQR